MIASDKPADTASEARKITINDDSVSTSDIEGHIIANTSPWSASRGGQFGLWISWLVNFVWIIIILISIDIIQIIFIIIIIPSPFIFITVFSAIFISFVDVIQIVCSLFKVIVIFIYYVSFFCLN